MSLDLSQSVAASGLANVSAQIALVSQNISNASTPGYAREAGTQTSLTADGQGFGVWTGPATRDVDLALQGAALTQDGAVSSLQTTQTALSAIDAALGAPGSGTDLGSLLGALRDGFATLADNPSNASQQSSVVDEAATLARGVNQLSATYASQRQAAQDSIVADVATLNAALSGIGRLSAQIVSLQARGAGTADLENTRDAQIQTVAQLVDVRVLPLPDGDVTLIAGGGLLLPTQPGAGQLAAPAAAAGAGAYYPGGGIPAITLNGQDVTGQLSGGRIGANLVLRDRTLPGAQAQLDEFAQTLATRFDAQGLTLFTRPDGTVPVPTGPHAQSGYVGFAADVGVNPAVAASPSDVRDGTHDVTGGTGFVVNPAGGPSGFATLAANVLAYAFGSNSSAGVAQPPPNVAGLGPSGALSAPYAAPADLSGFAADVVDAQSQLSATASDQLSQETSLQTALTKKLSDQTGVSIDTELANLTQLQNAYGANAKVLAAVQALWTTLFAAVAA